jgi:hypothetical protein
MRHGALRRRVVVARVVSAVCALVGSTALAQTALYITHLTVVSNKVCERPRDFGNIEACAQQSSTYSFQCLQPKNHSHANRPSHYVPPASLLSAAVLP